MKTPKSTMSKQFQHESMIEPILCHRALLLSKMIKSTAMSHTLALGDMFLHYSKHEQCILENPTFILTRALNVY